MESKKKRKYFDSILQCVIRDQIDCATQSVILKEQKEVVLKDRSRQSKDLILHCQITKNNITEDADIQILYDKQFDSYYVELQPNQKIVSASVITKQSTDYDDREFEFGISNIKNIFTVNLQKLRDYAARKIKYVFDINQGYMELNTDQKQKVDAKKKKEIAKSQNGNINRIQRKKLNLFLNKNTTNINKQTNLSNSQIINTNLGALSTNVSESVNFGNSSNNHGAQNQINTTTTVQRREVHGNLPKPINYGENISTVPGQIKGLRYNLPTPVEEEEGENISDGNLSEGYQYIEKDEKEGRNVNNNVSEHSSENGLGGPNL